MKLKEVIVIMLVITNLVLIILAFSLLHQYKVYTDNFNKKIGGIVAIVQEKYPNISENDLIQLLNGEEITNINFFEKYGIDTEKDAVIIQNNKMFVSFLVVDLFIVTTFSVIILLIFVKYNNSKNRKIEEITRYIEEINRGNYKLDIEDNVEDELSILKNEIYKTTVMLNEVAENSVRDKVNLKDSLSDISHQLKTPLTSMSIMVDNIMDNPNMDYKTREEFTKDIRREIINVKFLVDSLLKLSKLDANSVHFTNRFVRIREIIDDAVKNVSVLSDLKNVDIVVNGNYNASVNCDFKWQVEALTNILKNCVEHSKEDSRIEIFFDENNVYSKIEITDYGIGIEKQDLPHVFERFYKGKNSASESIGIGLALSKSIIENNGGYIDVKSEVGKGSTFIIKYFKE